MTNDEKDEDMALALAYEIAYNAESTDPEELAKIILAGLKKWRENKI